ncbi:MAG: VWA domain-containing protein [Nitrososphaerales archaeon]
MNPTEYAWATLQSLAQKEPQEIKVLVDNIDYPALESDSIGYVLRLSAPKMVNENLLSLHGMFFNNDEAGRAFLWRMFRSSVYHLCLHAAVTDYSIYREFASRFEPNNALFAISLAEDFALRGYMQARWPGLVLETAYANHNSFLRMRDLSAESNLGTRVAANLLSYSMVGKPIVQTRSALDSDTETVHTKLVDYSIEFSKIFASNDSEGRIPSEQMNSISMLKLAAVASVAELLERNMVVLSNVHSIPYTDNHGQNLLFENSIITSDQEFKANCLRDAFNELNVNLPEEKIRENEHTLEQEASNILGDWEYSLLTKQRLIDLYRQLDPASHFENFIFPSEDLAEFMRTRLRLVGPIKRILEQLRTLKTTNDEVAAQESGYVDIPAAIQVIASESSRNDVFIRDEISKKSEAWAILIDSSKSLENSAGEVREVAVCLTEVANDMISNSSSWACYAFNENLYILKDFTEFYRNSSKGRIGGLTSGLKTYLPDAIRLAAHRLSKTAEDVKVMLVASDGFPLGYEGIDEELAKAIEEVSKSGILMIGLGIGSSTIKKYFRSNCVVNGPYDLMKHFVKTYYELSSSF